MFDFNLDDHVDSGEKHLIRILVGNVKLSVVCPPFLLKQLQDTFVYQIQNVDRVKSHRIAHHMKEADKASLDNNKQQEAYHIKKAHTAQDWEGLQSLFRKTEIGTGMLSDVLMWIMDNGHEYELVDRITQGIKITIPKKNMLTLWDIQEDAMTALRSHGFRGVLQGATAFGKTVVAMHIIAELSTPTIIIADRKEYLGQWITQIESSFNLRTEALKGTTAHFFYSDHHEKPVIMVTSSTLLHSAYKPAKSEKLIQRNNNIKMLCKNAGLLIYDEAHRAASMIGMAACKNVTAPYRVGLTATANMNSKGNDPEYLALLGQVIYYLPPSDLVDLGFGKSVTIRGVMVDYDFGDIDKMLDDVDSYDEMLDSFIIHNTKRNNAIRRIVIEEAMEGNTILVLVDRLDQARSIALSSGENLIVFTHGGDDPRSRKKKIQDFRDGKVSCLICTHDLAGEGFNVPRINRVIISSGKDAKRTLQAIGRAMRLSDHKEAIVYDIIDPVAPFSTHFLARLEVYQSETAFIIEDNGRHLPVWVQNYLY